jgi:hypothetical protein
MVEPVSQSLRSCPGFSPWREENLGRSRKSSFGSNVANEAYD